MNLFKNYNYFLFKKNKVTTITLLWTVCIFAYLISKISMIIEEINMYEDNPLMYLGGLFEQTIYGNDPLGWLISGPKSVIKKVIG